MNITVTSILRHIQPIKGFVYTAARWIEGPASIIQVDVRPRRGATARCGCCRRPAPGYDRTPGQRSFRFISLWGCAVFLLYQPRRVNCRRCGVRVEFMPWASGKHRMCDAMRLFLARWARLLSWHQVAECFAVSWADVYSSVKWVVRFGLRHRDLSGVRALGVDEVCVGRKKFWTLVYQIDEGSRRLLWVGKERTGACLRSLLHRLGRSRRQSVEIICSDLFTGYLGAIKDLLPQALHILDRFHIRKNLGEALEEVRRRETEAHVKAGISPPLKKMRWPLLKHRRNWTAADRRRMREVIGSGLRSIRAFLLVESFEHFWTYNSPTWAGKFFDAWYRRVARSKIDPLKTKARTLKKYKPLLLNYFRAKKAFSNSIVEGMNNKLKTTLKRSYGFRTDTARKVALFHTLGQLPEPPCTHSFF